MREFGKKDELFYLAVIGDVVGSRRMTDRPDIQKKLEEAVKETNGRFLKNRLAARFTVTLGDEFQGLLRDGSDILKAVAALEEKLNGVPVRFGFGWGSLATELKPEAIGMDGPCFHRARASLDRCRAESRWAVITGFGEVEDRILNGILSILGEVRKGWTERQQHVVSLARRIGLRKEIAGLLGVVPSVVTETLGAAHFQAVLEAEDSFSYLIKLFGKMTEEGDNSAK